MTFYHSCPQCHSRWRNNDDSTTCQHCLSECETDAALPDPALGCGVPATCELCGEPGALREVSQCFESSGWHGVILACWECAPLQRRIEGCFTCIGPREEVAL